MLIFYYASMVILIPGILFSLYASVRVRTTFKKYSKVPTERNYQADEVAEMLLESHSCYSTRVVKVNGELTDNYDPRSNTLSLSQSVYGKNSVSAVAVSAHEVGHVCQYADNYLPLKLRIVAVPIVNYASVLALPLALCGVLFEYLSSVSTIGNVLIALGIILYSLSAVFAFITLPVEINASRRAMKMLTEGGFITAREKRQARSVLRAAALTYFASLFVSLLYLLRFVVIIGSIRKK